ncbi:UNVERIFIED_CONTAM: hypothetical protein K2H54_053401 [Gekko kuhli]
MHSSIIYYAYYAEESIINPVQKKTTGIPLFFFFFFAGKIYIIAFERVCCITICHPNANLLQGSIKPTHSGPSQSFKMILKNLTEDDKRINKEKKAKDGTRDRALARPLNTDRHTERVASLEMSLLES